jgi:Xaa-Pro aminopeptidase
VALGFALLRSDAQVDLFIEPGKLDGAARTWLGNDVSASPPGAMASVLDGFGGKRVRVDPQNSPVWFAQRLRAAGATVVDGGDVCLEPKARKNEAEREGMRRAHRRDGVALCRFLHWVRDAAERGETELSAAARLQRFRAKDPSYLGDSFGAISGAGEHGAVIHYHATPHSDRAIGARELYLIDSGGQYEDATTDVTRTVWTGGGVVPDAWRSQFTRVLKGVIALCTARFPQGVTGHRLDALARNALWQVGLDYDHGTGHGVGSVLSVHEGPVSISAVHRPVAVAEGMVVSDEPGFYQPGSHGIRIENLLLVVRADLPAAIKPFLAFETLTLAPIDRACIDVGLLDAGERKWLDAYHRRVVEEIGPELEGEAAEWLREACAEV